MGKVHGSYGDMKLGGGPPPLEHVMGDKGRPGLDSADDEDDAPGMGHAHELIDAVHARDGKRVLSAMKMLHQWAGADDDDGPMGESEDDAPDSEG